MSAPEQPFSKYDHKAIEQKWQDLWHQQGLYTTPDKIEGKENYYQLVEFSYPSGDLHTGHWYAFAVPDIHARYKRMKGFNVLYPMGFDAFGLPAENAAIKNGGDPKEWTEHQMETMRTQLKSMGAMFDWSREVVTCDPSYYKWTQWMFNQFLKHDLVYRANTKVNWCPKDQTVLANEQVVDGKCERCGSEVEQRDQDQWMLRITKYADRLIDDLETLQWPHPIKEAQKNWIGRSEGSEIDFQIKDSDKKVTVFTTRADTLFGVTYVVLAPEHPFVQELLLGVQNAAEIKEYIATTKKKSELDRQQSKEKTGVQLKGISIINPANSEEVPLWIADYVLAGYGTGAVMAVPAHDERDFEFAKKYNLEIRPVIFNFGSVSGYWDEEKKSWNIQKYEDEWNNQYSNYGKLVGCREFDGLESQEAKKKITEFVGGKLVSTYRLRDWGISRQRFWGCPIPIVYDPEGKAHPVPDEHLPWLLPDDVDHTPDGTAPLARSKKLLERTETLFGKGWRPEVETMDTFVDSSWYFYRYLDNKNEDLFATPEKMAAWMPIDLYMGGAEHTTMHLLYSRFWTKALFDIGLVQDQEAYMVRRNRGLILGPDGNKMSKSKGNVINPDEIVDRLGADTVRMYLAFMGPYGVTGNYPWDPNGVVGVRRFLERVWNYFILWQETREKDLKVGDTIGYYSGKIVNKTDSVLHKTIKKVTEDIEEFKFNTAISSMMIFTNEVYKEKREPMISGGEILSSESYQLTDFQMRSFLQLLAPFAPHITEELWHTLGEKDSIHLAPWPTFDPSKVVDEEVTIGVQINGKLRGEITAKKDESKEVLKETALALPKIQEYLKGKTVSTVVVVPGRIINIVIKE
jgi:leucyl-tRNA synthetase